MKSFKFGKRTLALMMALVLVFGMSTVASAAGMSSEDTTYAAPAASVDSTTSNQAAEFLNIPYGAIATDKCTLEPYLGVTRTFVASMTWLSNTPSGGITVELYRDSDNAYICALYLDSSNGFYASKSLTLPKSGSYTVRLLNECGATVNGLAYFKD